MAIEAKIYIKDSYHMSVADDDVTASEASTGDATSWERVVENNSGSNITQVKAWLDVECSPYISISNDDATWNTGTTEDTGITLADISDGGNVSIYIQRTIPAGTSSDTKEIIIIHFSYFSL